MPSQLLPFPQRTCPLTHIFPQIEYKGKGYFSGRSHSFKALLTPPGSSNPAKKYEGLWHEVSKDLDTDEVFTDVTSAKEEVTVGPIDVMHDFESRKLWQHVARGIREGDYETASREKSKIEVRPSPSHPHTGSFGAAADVVYGLPYVERAATAEAGRADGRNAVAAVAFRARRVGPGLRASREAVQRRAPDRGHVHLPAQPLCNALRQAVSSALTRSWTLVTAMTVGGRIVLLIYRVRTIRLDSGYYTMTLNWLLVRCISNDMTCRFSLPEEYKR